MFAEVHSVLKEYLAGLEKELTFELVDFNIRRQGKTVHVEIAADKEKGGITIDECTAINKRVSRYLEDNPLISDDYVVEVSSPGLDRPLKTEKDFKRVLNLEVRFHLNDFIEGKKEHAGVVEEVNEVYVKVATKQKNINIPLSSIQKAIQIIS